MSIPIIEISDKSLDPFDIFKESKHAKAILIFPRGPYLVVELYQNMGHYGPTCGFGSFFLIIKYARIFAKALASSDLYYNDELEEFVSKEDGL